MSVTDEFYVDVSDVYNYNPGTFDNYYERPIIHKAVTNLKQHKKEQLVKKSKKMDVFIKLKKDTNLKFKKKPKFRCPNTGNHVLWSRIILIKHIQLTSHI